MMQSEASKRAALVTAVTAAFLTPFMGSSVNLALPVIADELMVDAVTLAWVSASYLLAAAMFLVPLGRIADIHGRKRVFLWGLGVFTAFSFLSGLAPNVEVLIAFRFGQGLGSAMIFGTGMAILTSVFPPHERGKALGITVAAVYVGLSLGPLAGGFLTAELGWRSVFLSTVPLGSLAMIQVLRGLKGEWADARGETFDSRGSVMYSLALMTLVLGLSRLPGKQGLMLLFASVVIFGAFFVWEAHHRAPVLDVKLFRDNRVFAFSNLAALINYSATFAVIFLMSLYLQNVQGLTPKTAGLVLVCQPALMALFSPFAGRLSDRIEPRILASVGMAFTTVALVFMAFFDTSTSLVMVITALIVLGIGLALFSSPNTNAVMGSVGKRSLGVASGTVGTMRLVGQMLSMGLAMMLLALFVGHTPLTPGNHPEFIGAMRATFAISAALCFLGIFASMARGKVRAPLTADELCTPLAADEARAD